MYDFTTVHNRQNTASFKWDRLKEVYALDQAEGILPMWVADMDFAIAPFIADAMIQRIENGVFGYSFPDEDVSESIVNWLARKHATKIEKEWLIYETGVIPSMALALSAFTEPGDRVLVHGPVYPPFRNTPANLDREVVTFALTEKDSTYELNFEQFEAALADNIKAFIFCNPHNPGGKVWSKEDVTRIVELCEKYNVLLISDEIHADLVFKPHQHVTALSVAKNSSHIITCMAPTKTFNLAGVQAAYMIVEDKEKREKLQDLAMKSAHMGLTVLGATAMKAAYNEGDKWLTELLDQIQTNIDYVKQTIEEKFPEVKIPEPEGTYLVWIDYRQLGISEKEMMHALLHEGKLALEPGTKYGPEGDGFLRMNVACPFATVQDGVERFSKAVASLKK